MADARDFIMPGERPESALTRRCIADQANA
jgi:hypothetical protein